MTTTLAHVSARRIVSRTSVETGRAGFAGRVRPRSEADPQGAGKAPVNRLRLTRENAWARFMGDERLGSKPAEVDAIKEWEREVDKTLFWVARGRGLDLTIVKREAEEGED